MAELEASGQTLQDCWRSAIPAEGATLGRVPEKSRFAVPWDDKISGLHATLTWHGSELRVRREPSRNPIFFQAREYRVGEEFVLRPGQSFVIGETTFTLHESLPYSEISLSRAELREVPYTDAGDRIAVLASLPELIRLSGSEAELVQHVVEALLRGIPHAEAVAVVCLDLQPAAGAPSVQVRGHVQRGGAAGFRPSERLVRDAIGKERRAKLAWWRVTAKAPEYTLDSVGDWALCAPMPDEPLPGWGVYVAGRLTEPLLNADGSVREDRLKGDLKFTETVAEVFGSLRQLRDLQRRHALLARFLSRPVLQALVDRTDLDKVLEPRTTDVSVLFCDLRGSCLIAEGGRDDLQALWRRVSAALGIMTANITDSDGVVGDFQGDAAMGFWGWPLEVDDAAARAARAALGIRRHFRRAARDVNAESRPGPLSGFTCGIGIASGPAIAGKLGTYDQFKVGVFGPVVNLAARLESMTKLFGVPVLLDDATATRLGAARATGLRCRRLAHVCPAGMTTPVIIHELLPSQVEPDAMKETDRRDYETGLDLFATGRWPESLTKLRRLLAAGDRPAQFLQQFMDRHRNTPPAGWDGIIRLESK